MDGFLSFMLANEVLFWYSMIMVGLLALILTVILILLTDKDEGESNDKDD